MAIYTCKHCGKQFSYCRRCVIRPKYAMGAGFCSIECCEEYKSKQEENKKKIEEEMNQEIDLYTSSFDEPMMEGAFIGDIETTLEN